MTNETLFIESRILYILVVVTTEPIILPKPHSGDSVRNAQNLIEVKNALSVTRNIQNKNS